MCIRDRFSPCLCPQNIKVCRALLCLQLYARVHWPLLWLYFTWQVHSHLPTTVGYQPLIRRWLASLLSGIFFFFFTMSNTLGSTWSIESVKASILRQWPCGERRLWKGRLERVMETWACGWASSVHHNWSCKIPEGMYCHDDECRVYASTSVVEVCIHFDSSHSYIENPVQ